MNIGENWCFQKITVRWNFQKIWYW